MFDLLGELGSIFPWLYRGWAYMFSANYRKLRHEEWKSRGVYFKLFDIFFSVLFITAELLLISMLWK